MRYAILGLAACAGFVALTSAASAGNLDRPYVQKAPPFDYTAPFDWSGFYAGANMSYGWGRGGDSFDVFGTKVNAKVNLADLGLGGQIGYNLMFGRVVAGIEAGANWANMKGSSRSQFDLFGFLPSEINANLRTTYYGSITPRLGIALGDDNRWLLYTKGGYAFGEMCMAGDASVLGFQVAKLDRKCQTNGGWTAGAGLEVMLNRALSLKAEYNYYDLGKIRGTAMAFGTPVPISSKFEVQDVKLGVNYHF